MISVYLCLEKEKQKKKKKKEEKESDIYSIINPSPTPLTCSNEKCVL